MVVEGKCVGGCGDGDIMREGAMILPYNYSADRAEFCISS